MITLFLAQNYDSNISRQLLINFKTLTILSIIWSPFNINLEYCDPFDAIFSFKCVLRNVIKNNVNSFSAKLFNVDYSMFTIGRLHI